MPPAVARRVHASQKRAPKRKRQLRSAGSLSPVAVPGSGRRKRQRGSAEPEQDGSDEEEDEEETSSSSSEEEAVLLEGKRRRSAVNYL